MATHWQPATIWQPTGNQQPFGNPLATSLVSLLYSWHQAFAKLHKEQISKKQTTGLLFSLQISCFQLRTYQTFRERDISLYSAWSADTDQAWMDTRRAICSTKLPLRIDKINATPTN